MKSYSFACLFCLHFAAISAIAQDSVREIPPVPVVQTEIPTEPEISLEELIQRALAKNPQLPIARENVEAARLRLGAARSRSNATLQIVPGIGNREARDEEILLSQPLDLFGKRRARADVADAELRRALAEESLAQRSIIVAVKNAAAELFAAQEAESLGQYQVEVAQLFRDAAARRAQLGDIPPVQVQRIELELLRTQNEYSNAQAERQIRRATLNHLIGQAPETSLRVALPDFGKLTNFLRVRPLENSTVAQNSASEIPVSASSQIGSDLVNSRSQLLSGIENRPDIASAQATIETQQAQIRVLESERKPDIEIQARRNSVFGNGSNALRAVITIPLFSSGANRGERRALAAETRAQESQIALLRSQAATQVEQAMIRLKQQRKTVENYRLGIVPQSLDLLRKTQIGYAAGASTYLEVLEAQRTLRQVQSEYLQALVGIRSNEAALESALGNQIPTSSNGEIQNPAVSITQFDIAAPGTVPKNVIPLDSTNKSEGEH